MARPPFYGPPRSRRGVNSFLVWIYLPVKGSKAISALLQTPTVSNVYSSISVAGFLGTWRRTRSG
jgi:hypothetical protein